MSSYLYALQTMQGQTPHSKKYKAKKDQESLRNRSINSILAGPGARPADFAINENAYKLNTDALQSMRDLAKNGNSAWMNMMTGKQRMEQDAALQQAQQQQMGQQAQAQSALAMRGGLSSGARERLASGGARNMMQAQQDLARQGMIARQDIGIQGEQQRLNALQALPGMEIQALQPLQQRDQARLGVWQQKMQDWAAGKQAQALASTKGKK